MASYLDLKFNLLYYFITIRNWKCICMFVRHPITAPCRTRGKLHSKCIIILVARTMASRSYYFTQNLFSIDPERNLFTVSPKSPQAVSPSLTFTHISMYHSTSDHINIINTKVCEDICMDAIYPDILTGLIPQQRQFIISTFNSQDNLTVMFAHTNESMSELRVQISLSTQTLCKFLVHWK